MKVQFEENQAFSAEDPLVTVQADSLSGQAKAVMDYIEQFDWSNRQIIPVKTDDRILMLKIDDIIMVEIYKTTLTIFMLQGMCVTKEGLGHFQNRINRRSFVQVSKHALINVDHLQSLSDGFSGNMSAKLSNKVSTSVSRKYVKTLMQYLGV